MITDVLKGTLDKPYGTGNGLGLGVPAAGKTGTTNSNKDTWFCGYTKHYTTAVWVGYDTPKAMPGVYGKTYSGKIWQEFMTGINNGLPVMDWDMPATVSLKNVDSTGEKTDAETGRKDLFSSVAEQTAKANGSKWKEEEDRKKVEAQAQRDLESSQAAKQAVEQTVSSLQSLIGELSALTHRDSSTEETINTAYGLLDQLVGTEYYDGLKTQLDEAANHAAYLPKQEDSTSKPQEIGPGVTKPKETVPPVFPGDMDSDEDYFPGFGPGGPDSDVQSVGPGME